MAGMNSNCCKCKQCTPEYYYIPNYTGNELAIDPAFEAQAFADYSGFGSPGYPFGMWLRDWGGVMGQNGDPQPLSDAHGCFVYIASNTYPGGNGNPRTVGSADVIDNQTSGWPGYGGSAGRGWNPVAQFESTPCTKPCLITGEERFCHFRLTLELYNVNHFPNDDPPYHSISWQGEVHCPTNGAAVKFIRTGGYDTRPSLTLKDTLSQSRSSTTVSAAGETFTYDLVSAYSDIFYQSSFPISMAAWLTVNSPVEDPSTTHFTGSTPVSITADPNTTGSPRVGTIIAACNVHTVIQPAAE